MNHMRFYFGQKSVRRSTSGCDGKSRPKLWIVPCLSDAVPYLRIACSIRVSRWDYGQNGDFWDLPVKCSPWLRSKHTFNAAYTKSRMKFVYYVLSSIQFKYKILINKIRLDCGTVLRSGRFLMHRRVSC